MLELAGDNTASLRSVIAWSNITDLSMLKTLKLLTNVKTDTIAWMSANTQMQSLRVLALEMCSLATGDPLDPGHDALQTATAYEHIVKETCQQHGYTLKQLLIPGDDRTADDDGFILTQHILEMVAKHCPQLEGSLRVFDKKDWQQERDRLSFYSRDGEEDVLNLDFRRLLINYAIDSHLAGSIFRMIPMFKPAASGPLECLELPMPERSIARSARTWMNLARLNLKSMSGKFGAQTLVLAEANDAAHPDLRYGQEMRHDSPRTSMKRLRTYCLSVWRKTWRRTKDCYYVLPVIFLHLWWFWSYLWTIEYLFEFLTARQTPSYDSCKKHNLKYCLQDELVIALKKQSKLLDTVEANIFFVLLTSQLIITIGEQITMVLGQSGPWSLVTVEVMKLIEWVVWYAMQLQQVDQSERRQQALEGLAARCPEYWQPRNADGLYPSLISTLLIGCFVSHAPAMLAHANYGSVHNSVYLESIWP
ncbi:hypothetical protein AC579_6764 [Pseudocercospora musae]|uniref:Uncharacterized protein n=1 Tax=Pseudocercospora musae TaxID=113226 RepID=A0A139HFC8_9PEZI|nr:hypothetical protein AC579_6764 [Pseudocercospora musae]